VRTSNEDIPLSPKSPDYIDLKLMPTYIRSPKSNQRSKEDTIDDFHGTITVKREKESPKTKN